MDLSKLRYYLTKHTERFLFTCENFRLLIHPSVTNYDLLRKIDDDINLMPKIKRTIDNVDIKFIKFDYDENLYSKSELLAFIFASVNTDWNIIEGLDLDTGESHFWLKHEDVIFDPSLAIITKDNIYSTRFKALKEIKNESVKVYLTDNDNLLKFYKKKRFKFFKKFNTSRFSINFINEILTKFNDNIRKEYILDATRIERIKEHFMLDNFIELRQVLTQKRRSYLQSVNIAVHPSIDESILETIKKNAMCISSLMKHEYNINLDYYKNSLYECYGLSIMLNLFDGSFKLIQGGIPYKKREFNEEKACFYQHSWLEKDGVVYDPALRIVTTKELYYTFVQKQDEYTKEETENILRRIGFNLTHFKDFMNGKQIGNDESIMYRYQINKIDSPEMRDKGERLLSLIKRYNLK